MSHHNHQECHDAFAAAHTMLRELERAGIKNPSVTLYPDASGRLNLGYTEPTKEQRDKAISLISSERLGKDEGLYFISSCCGFVSYAKRL